MNTRFSIRYHYQVMEDDIPSLSREWNARIRETVEKKLTNHPEVFGKPLQRSLASCRKLRVGDYRVIFTISKTEVKVWAIGHRSTIYGIAEKRINKFL
ncbi:MAG TPA: type II toxin-antitoxin system RelE/ParE family toxin [Candidatus Paceibacterota bacterium]